MMFRVLLQPELFYDFLNFSLGEQFEDRVDRGRRQSRNRSRDIKYTKTITAVPLRNISSLKLMVGNQLDEFRERRFLICCQLLGHKDCDGWLWYHVINCVSGTKNPLRSQWL